MKYTESKNVDGTLVGYYDENGKYAFIDSLYDDETKLLKDDIEIIPMSEATFALLQTNYVNSVQQYENNQYQRDRSRAYPAITDQLDTLYHGGYDAWKTSIDAVKQQYPKGQ